MYPNLIGEMKYRKVTAIEIGAKLNIHRNSVHNKIHGKKTFSLDEALEIHGNFFSDVDFATLFYKKTCE